MCIRRFVCEGDTYVHQRRAWLHASRAESESAFLTCIEGQVCLLMWLSVSWAESENACASRGWASVSMLWDLSVHLHSASCVKSWAYACMFLAIWVFVGMFWELGVHLHSNVYIFITHLLNYARVYERSLQVRVAGPEQVLGGLASGATLMLIFRLSAWECVCLYWWVLRAR